MFQKRLFFSFLVFEVTFTRNGHTHMVLLAEIDRVLIVDASSGMSYGYDTSLVGYLNAVGEGEEGIACHYSSVEVETKTLCLSDRLTECVNS